MFLQPHFPRYHLRSIGHRMRSRRPRPATIMHLLYAHTGDKSLASMPRRDALHSRAC